MTLLSRISAVLTTLCVALMVFFPLPAGPFPVTHGPASALRASVAAVLLLLTISTLKTSSILRPEPGRRQPVLVIYPTDSASMQGLALRC